MGVSKNNGKTPQNIHFNRVFLWFSPSILGTPIFGNIQMDGSNLLIRSTSDSRIESRIPGHTKTVSSRWRTSRRSSNAGALGRWFFSEPILWENGKILKNISNSNSPKTNEVIGNIYSSKYETKVETSEN